MIIIGIIIASVFVGDAISSFEMLKRIKGCGDPGTILVYMPHNPFILLSLLNHTTTVMLDGDYSSSFCRKRGSGGWLII